MVRHVGLEPRHDVGNVLRYPALAEFKMVRGARIQLANRWLETNCLTWSANPAAGVRGFEPAWRCLE